MEKLDLLSKLEEYRDEVNAIIKSFLPPLCGSQRNIMNAMNYSILVGGKRLRPTIMYDVYRLYGGIETVIEPFIAAIEMIHTYSLVHDDLPAMDNDTLRRGKPTTHAKFGEAMGILAGDGLLNYAYETASMGFSMVEDENLPRVAEAFSLMTYKAGIYGMVGGQVIDIENEENGDLASKDEDDILEIYELKTAALLEASFMIPAILAGADDEVVDTLEQIAKNVGIAFQIRDDILDMTSTTEELGKTAGSDKENSKITYASVFGVEAADKKVKELSDEAVSLFDSLDLGEKGDFLRSLIISLSSREN